MLLDPKELEASAVMDPSIVEFIKQNPGHDNDWDDYKSLREYFTTITAAQLKQIGPANPEVLTEEYIDIPLRDGFQSKLKVSKPANPPAGGSPLIIFAFGGGWIGGDVDQGTAIARIFTKAFGAVVVSVSYRLAPENKFPCSQLDVWDSAKWIAENAAKLGADPTKGFIMSGISAGGSIASAMVTKAIEEPLAYPFTGQWLGIPALMDEIHVPEKYKKYFLSRKQNTDVPILKTGDMESIHKHTQADESSPLRYPITSKAPLSKQPKAFIMADGMDPIRDDALIWDEMLKEAGVQTRCKLYPGCPHGHWGVYIGLEVSNKALIDMVQGVGWLLGKDISVEDVFAAF